MNIPYLLFEKITDNFSDDLIIGSGGFGNVYKGVLYNKDLIAVKLLHAVQALDARPFNNEVGNLFRVDHPNIVRLLGYCDEVHSKYVEINGEKVSCKHIYRVLCFEYFPAGSLDKLLKEQSVAPDWSTRYNIIKGICEGLNFLHGCEPQIFHLDLKPGNILLNSSIVPKLADFGLSRLFSESHTYVTQQRIGTDKYMPPEYRTGGNISDKNDVFSFGVVMIEIMEGYSLFQEMGDVTQFKEEVLAKCSSMIEPTPEYRKEKLIHQVRTCIDIAMHCVNSERINRPSIASILDTLNATEIDMPNTQIAVVPLSPTIDLEYSLAETLKMMTSELDSIKLSATNMEQVPDIREASSNVEDPLITGRTENRETSSNVDGGLIIGRVEEKKEILSILSENGANEMVILPIYGIGGIGKTTLAQLVINDSQFNGYSRVWVYVSEQLDLYKIGNSIISQLSKEISNIANMQIMHNRLGELFADKRILIVLDDLWEDKPRELDKLKAMLRLGELDKLKAMVRLGKGSKVIIVTTRDEAIARKICSNVRNVPYKLEMLTDDMCWVIIKQKCDFENQPGKNQLEKIGKDIARKCGGVALAAQSLGYMLRDMTPDQWESVRDSDIWNLSTSEDPSVTTHEVLASLRLSYFHMHKFLKLCFSYCAVFPKGHLIAKYDLIHQWIALEFVPSGIFDSMQLCEQYVRQLLGMSFLQYATTPSGKHSTFFTMHDLVHDLARVVDKVNKNGNVVGSSYQYALVTDPSNELSCPENIKALHLDWDDIIELPDGIFSPAKNLLVLDITGFLNEKLPNSIGKLKQLRYLRAKYIRGWRIPKFINKLTKLNYLNLSRSSLKALPDSIGDMKGLMHLDLSHCEKLSELPLSFGDLKQLVYLNLSHCSVPISESWGGFTKLQYLNLSRQRRLSQAFEVLSEVIGKLTKLQYLNLSFFTMFDQTKVLPEVFGKLTKLRYLNLAGCMKNISGSDIQDLLVSVSTLYNLEHLDLADSAHLTSIPDSIGNLTKLHTLNLLGCNIQKLPAWMTKMASLKIVNMMTLDECGSNLRLLAAVNPFKLKISKLEDVKSLEEAQSIKLIEKGRMNDLGLKWTVGCHKRYVDDKDVLEKLVPPNTIRSLNITGYMSLSFPKSWLMGIGQYLPNVSKITLLSVPNVSEIPPLGQLPNLEDLSLYWLDNLEECNTAGELMFPKLDILDIVSCPKLRLKPCLPRALWIEASDNVLMSGGESVSQTGASSSSSLLTDLMVTRSRLPLYQWTLLQHVSALHRFTVTNCSDLASCSPGVIQRLSSLKLLELEDDILTELPTWLLELTSLQRLTITVPKLEKLNDTRQFTGRLQSLILRGCESLISLPQWLGELTSLKELNIFGCKGIKYLPGSIRQLTKLQSLCIDDDKMGYSLIRKLFSSISADTDEVNIGRMIEEYKKEEDRISTKGSDSNTDEEDKEVEFHLKYKEEDIYESTDYESTEEGTEENGDEDVYESTDNRESTEEDSEEHEKSKDYEESTKEDREEHKEEDTYESTDDEESTEEDREDHEEEDIYESRDYEESTEEEREEHEDDINNNVTSTDALATLADANAASLIRSPSAPPLFEFVWAAESMSGSPADAVNTSTHENMTHKHRVRDRHTNYSRTIPMANPGSPADAVNTSTHENMTHKHRVRDRHTNYSRTATQACSVVLIILFLLFSFSQYPLDMDQVDIHVSIEDL